jgi:hypothetical protein
LFVLSCLHLSLCPALQWLTELLQTWPTGAPWPLGQEQPGAWGAAVQQAWEEVLRDLPAAADSALAQQQMELLAAQQRVRVLYAPLQLSLQERLQVGAVLQQLIWLPAEDLLVHRFRAAYQVSLVANLKVPKLRMH